MTQILPEYAYNNKKEKKEKKKKAVKCKNLMLQEKAWLNAHCPQTQVSFLSTRRKKKSYEHYKGLGKSKKFWPETTQINL